MHQASPPTVTRTPHVSSDENVRRRSAETECIEYKTVPETRTHTSASDGTRHNHGTRRRQRRRRRYYRYRRRRCDRSHRSNWRRRCRCRRCCSRRGRRRRCSRCRRRCLRLIYTSMRLALVAGEHLHATTASSACWQGRAKGCGAHQSNGIVHARVVSAPIASRAAWEEAPLRHVRANQPY